MNQSQIPPKPIENMSQEELMQELKTALILGWRPDVSTMRNLVEAYRKGKK